MTKIRSLALFFFFVAPVLAFAGTAVTPDGIAVDAAGNIFFADSGSWQVRKIDAATGTITDVGKDLITQGSNNGLAVDAAGNLFIADGQGGVLRRVDAVTGKADVIASGLDHPFGIAVDRAGDVYFAEWSGNRVGKVNMTTGIISTVAGNGLMTFSGDFGAATSAGVPNPSGVAVDEQGNVYIAEWASNDVNRVRVVSAQTGIITTLAGNGSCGALHDGGVAAEQSTCGPFGVVLDKAGNVFVTDIYHRVYVIAVDTQRIISIAGVGTSGFSGDGGPARSAALNTPLGIAVDRDDNIYIADAWNNRIRKVTAATGIITTIAGDGSPSHREVVRRRATRH